jgi:hypothetical protein
MTRNTLLRKRDIRQRMQCSGQVAHQIEQAFNTVEELVAAVQSDAPLTDVDGIGPATAGQIESWWAVRFEQEEQIDSATFERTGAQTATIYNNASWGDAIAVESTDGGDP